MRFAAFWATALIANHFLPLPLGALRQTIVGHLMTYAAADAGGPARTVPDVRPTDGRSIAQGDGTEKPQPAIVQSLPCYQEHWRPLGIRPAGVHLMLTTDMQRPAIRTLRGWAISVLQEAGAICECDEHAWMRDRADPHARERAILVARWDPPSGVSPEKAVEIIEDVLGSIGDTCAECPPE